MEEFHLVGSSWISRCCGKPGFCCVSLQINDYKPDKSDWSGQLFFCRKPVNHLLLSDVGLTSFASFPSDSFFKCSLCNSLCFDFKWYTKLLVLKVLVVWPPWDTLLLQVVTLLISYWSHTSKKQSVLYSSYYSVITDSYYTEKH